MLFIIKMRTGKMFTLVRFAALHSPCEARGSQGKAVGSIPAPRAAGQRCVPGIAAVRRHTEQGTRPKGSWGRRRRLAGPAGAP